MSSNRSKRFPTILSSIISLDSLISKLVNFLAMVVAVFLGFLQRLQTLLSHTRRLVLKFLLIYILIQLSSQHCIYEQHQSFPLCPYSYILPHFHLLRGFNRQYFYHFSCLRFEVLVHIRYLHFKLCLQVYLQILKLEMQARGSFNSTELVEQLGLIQAQSFSQIVDEQIQLFCNSKDRQRSMQKHDQISEYFDQKENMQKKDDFDNLLEKISKYGTLEQAKDIIEVIEWNATVAREREKLFLRQKFLQKQETNQEKKDAEAGVESQPQRTKPVCDLAILARQFQKKYKSGKKQIYIKAPGNKTERLQFLPEDLQKLQPNQDLNDTIIQNYLKIIKNIFLAEEESARMHFYSTFFFHKLMGDFGSQLIEGQVCFSQQIDRDSIKSIKERVAGNYSKVKRWTKNVDIFEKQLIVFPINSFGHWFCVFILYPDNISSSHFPCELIYCDSMFEKKIFIIQSIKEYLRLQLLEKKGKKIKPFEQNVKSYQLLLPRQRNTHDCGLYMLTYIDELLNKGYQKLKSLRFIENRNQLNLFPRKLTATMRRRLLKFIDRLSLASSWSNICQICKEFLVEKQSITKGDALAIYDQIDEKQFQKYQSTIIFQDKTLYENQEDEDYCNLIRFYLDAEVNYYDKDNQPE